MNEQVEKIIFDYKQGLGQQAFYTFDLLNRHVTQETSRDLVLQELDRIRGQFDADPLVQSASLEETEDRLNKEIVAANTAGDYTRVMEIEDDLTAIRRVKSLMNN